MDIGTLEQEILVGTLHLLILNHAETLDIVRTNQLLCGRLR